MIEQLAKLKQNYSREEVYETRHETAQGIDYTIREDIAPLFNSYFIGEGHCLTKSDKDNISLYVGFADGDNTRDDMDALNKYLGDL